MLGVFVMCLERVLARVVDLTASPDAGCGFHAVLVFDFVVESLCDAPRFLARTYHYPLSSHAHRLFQQIFT